jgi:hypothetical protein
MTLTETHKISLGDREAILTTPRLAELSPAEQDSLLEWLEFTAGSIRRRLDRLAERERRPEDGAAGPR